MDGVEATLAFKIAEEADDDCAFEVVLIYRGNLQNFHFSKTRSRSTECLTVRSPWEDQVVLD